MSKRPDRDFYLVHINVELLLKLLSKHIISPLLTQNAVVHLVSRSRSEKEEVFGKLFARTSLYYSCEKDMGEEEELRDCERGFEGGPRVFELF